MAAVWRSGRSLDDEVESIISEAMDLCALDQIARLNTAHIQDQLLPDNIESRFRKLKSFPQSASQIPKSPPSMRESKLSRLPKSESQQSRGEMDLKSSSDSKELGRESPPYRVEMELKSSSDSKKLERETSPYRGEMALKSSSDLRKSEREPLPNHREVELKCSSDSKKSERESSPRRGEMAPKRLFNSGRVSRESSPSPRRKGGCCFAFSPTKKEKKNRKVEGGMMGLDEEYWKVNEEMLSDLKVFSVKEQRKSLKKLVKEQEKASREADKLLDLVKQASMRMEAVAAPDEFVLSDDEIEDQFK